MSESIINTFNICLPTIQYDSEFEKCQFLLKKEIDLIILEKNILFLCVYILGFFMIFEINILRILINMMKQFYEYSLYLVGYNNRHDDIHRFECKLENLEEMYHNLNQKISHINIKFLDCITKEDFELIRTELIKTK